MLPKVLLLCPSIVARRMRDRNRVPLCREGTRWNGNRAPKGGYENPAREDRYAWFVHGVLGGDGVPRCQASLTFQVNRRRLRGTNLTELSRIEATRVAARSSPSFRQGPRTSDSDTTRPSIRRFGCLRRCGPPGRRRCRAVARYLRPLPARSRPLPPLPGWAGRTWCRAGCSP